MIRIGTRGSALALAQAGWVAERIDVDTELVTINAAGSAADKSRWVSELERALLSEQIDIAVHSAKDVPAQLADGLALVAIPEREDPRDGICGAGSLAELPPGAKVGTSSLRRAAQVRAARADLDVVTVRGNVDTRLRKLQEGAVDATLLACAGLTRLGLSSRITQPVSVDDMLPAVAQGAIGVEIRADDDRTAHLLAPINHAQTALAVAVERAFLAKLDGSCKTPIAGLAQLVAPDRLLFCGQILAPDGRRAHATRREGRPETAIAMAEDAAAELIALAGPDFFRASF